MSTQRKRCTKRRFRSEIDAKIVLSRVQWQDKPTREKVEQRVYRCNICRGYHLTSQPQRTQIRVTA